jgi:hypothetical protein
MMLPTASRDLRVRHRSHLAAVLLVLVAAFSCALAWANTRWGVGLRGGLYAFMSGAHVTWVLSRSGRVLRGVEEA